MTNRIPEILTRLEPAVHAALLAGAETIVQSAQARVPVRTGRLRDAIHVEARPEEGVFVVAGDSKTWYGHIVEHGSVRMPAHPFLVPALEENRAVVEAEIVAAIRRTVG